MAVTKLTLHQFGPFAQTDLDLVPGVNVLLGANGTGKTIAAKGLYALLKGLAPEQPAGTQPREAVRAKFAGVFRPDDGDIRRLVSRVHGRATGRVRVEFDDRDAARLSIGSTRPVASLEFPTTDGGLPDIGDAALFLPSRALLALRQTRVEVSPWGRRQSPGWCSRLRRCCHRTTSAGRSSRP